MDARRPPEAFKVHRVEIGQGRWGGRPGDWELAMTPSITRVGRRSVKNGDIDHYDGKQ